MMESDDDVRARGLAALAYSLDDSVEPLMVAIADTPMILLGESTWSTGSPTGPIVSAWHDMI